MSTEVTNVDDEFVKNLSTQWAKFVRSVEPYKVDLPSPPPSTWSQSLSSDLLQTYIDAILKQLLPLKVCRRGSVHIPCCIAALHFLLAMLKQDTCGDSSRKYPATSLSAAQLRFESITFEKIFQQLDEAVTSTISTLETLAKVGGGGGTIPPLAYTFGLLSSLLEEAPSQSVDNILAKLEDRWECLRGLANSIVKRLLDQSGGARDEEEVLIFDLVRLFKCSLKALLADKDNSTSKLRTTVAFRVCLDMLCDCLIDCTSMVASEETQPQSSQQCNSRSTMHPVILTLFVRNLCTLVKCVCSSDLLAHLKDDLNNLIFQLFCPVPMKSLSTAADTSGIGLSATLQSVLLTVTKKGKLEPTALEVKLHDAHFPSVLQESDVGLPLRLILLCGLKLANMLDLKSVAMIPLLEAIRSAVILTGQASQKGSVLHVYECFCVGLMAADDSHLHSGLAHWTILEEKILSAEPTVRDLLLPLVPNAHWLFAYLAATIGYTPYLFVDWLVSPETECLLYLVHYLRRYRGSREGVPSPSSTPTRTLSRAGDMEVAVNKCAQDVLVRCRNHLAPPSAFPLLPAVSASAPGTSGFQMSQPELTSWPRTRLTWLFAQLAKCLETLSEYSGIPYSPKPLIRSLRHAVTVLKGDHQTATSVTPLSKDEEEQLINYAAQ